MDPIQLTEDEILERAVGEPNGESPELLPGLTPELEQALIGIVQEFERESYTTWRYQYREFLEAGSFWKDIQSGFYDHETDMFRAPTFKDVAGVGDAGSRFQFVTNLYRALGWTIVSVLGQKRPTTVFLPSDYTNESDVTAAHAAEDVVPIIERNNRINLLHMKAAYHAYVDGVFAGYVRYLADGDEFGYIKEDQLGLTQTGRCAACGEYTVINDPLNPQSCSTCGAPLTPGEYELIELPQVIGTRQVPRGREVITIHGGLELRLPPWVQDQRDMPYLGLVNEVHKAQIRAAYGKRGENVEGTFGASGPFDSWDRFARMSLLEPNVGYYSVANTNLVTLKRYWMTRKALYAVKNTEQRDQLLKIFTRGCYVAFVEQNQILDARDEALDDHWVICRAMEGHGMFTPALGSSMISIQKRINTLTNFIMEWVEYSAAGQGTFVNAGVINYNALRQQRRAPGMIYPIRVPAGTAISSALYTDKPAQIAGEIFRHVGELTSFGQQVTGATPTVSGGTEMSLKPTTYLADREQALGKMFVPWQHLREFWARLMWLAVKAFAENRTDDERYSLPDPTGGASNHLVRLDNLQGEFDAYPEVNETFPRLWHQQQATFLQLMQSPDPMVQAILGNSRNFPYAKAMLGLPNLYVPSEDDRRKQELEIAQLLTQQPTVAIDPMTGAPNVIPSVLPDEYEDAHPQHEETVKQWAVSPAGVRAKAENPMGYKNVIAHGVAHHALVKLQMLANAPPALPSAPLSEPTAKPPTLEEQVKISPGTL